MQCPENHVYDTHRHTHTKMNRHTITSTVFIISSALETFPIEQHN